MTVTFKQVIKKNPAVFVDLEETPFSPPPSFGEYYKAVKATMDAEAAEKQNDVCYYFKSYVSFSETKPIKWEAHDHLNNAKENLNDCYQQLLLGARAYKKDTDATGLKVVCFKVDVLNPNTPMQFVAGYCKEEWAPKTKVFINGPKKAPFPKKASGHF